MIMGWGLGGQVDFAVGASHERSQFIVNNFYDVLGRVRNCCAVPVPPPFL